MKISKTLSKGRDVLESKMVREREDAHLYLLLFNKCIFSIHYMPRTMSVKIPS